MLNWNASFFYLCTCVVLSLLLCSAQSPQLTDVVVSSRGQVFVSDSGKGVLYRYDDGLVEQELVPLPSGGSPSRLALTSDESTLIACLNANCVAFDAKNLTKGPLRVFQDVLSSDNYMTLVSASVIGGGNSFYVGSSNATVNLIGQYGVDGAAGNVSRSSGNLFSVTASSFTRNWYGGFVAGSYTYFVVLDVSASTRTAVRVLRVCDNSNETSVAAMYEAEINCYSLSAVDSDSRLVGASLLGSLSNGGATLVIGLVTPNSSPIGRVCTVGLSSIDSAMNSASCSSTILPWRTNTSSTPSCPNQCSISSPGAIEVPADASNAAYLMNTDTDTYTSTLAFNYESLALLFIASTTSTGSHVVQEYNAIGTGSVQLFTWSMAASVTKLTWTSGQNYVYALTSSSVVQFPIEQCSNFTDCQSCASNVNPLCGWCSVEQKCSRRSQCQNSILSSRWVQGNTSQCPETSVTPPTFTLMRPTNLTLTISSGLPSPLAGESFLCVLSTASGVITIPCSQINQTTFTSNITSAVSQLNAPKLVVNVGFASSLLNIPFATSKVTTYNCAAATSCRSCLQNDGVCGWCNVEKRCTALNTSCSSFISVNPESGQTYMGVCSVLLNGTYMLPVMTSRPLVLNTKNLLPQSQGYQYFCMIQSSVISICLPASYVDSTSIYCLPTPSLISFPVGTAAMVANISLIWSNNSAVMYPIDPVGVIQVTLYNCSAFSVTACSSCLAVNIGSGYDCGWCSGTSRCVEPDQVCSSTFANQSNQCPSPMLNSVFPPSGPYQGGTYLTITGTDLGVTVGDIVSVTVGGVPCVIQSSGYIPGTQFMCITGSYTSGGTQQAVSISVAINRSGNLATVQSSFQYTYVKPSISSVSPKSGPMAGGTNVVIGGMFLNVGNGVKGVLLNGAMCVILQSSSTQITCTSYSQSVRGVGTVRVHIDNEVSMNNSVTFEYTNNPNYTSVSPLKTIPAGGITLTFNGTYLDVSQKAFLMINGITGDTPCNQSFSIVKCSAPPLGPGVSGPGVYLFPSVNYTIVMDGAPGPVGDSLKIEVVPNPVFTSINPNDITQTIGSVKSIRINGMNILNVDVLSEIMVTIGGERCTIELGTTTNAALSCQLHNVLEVFSNKQQASFNGVVVVSVGRYLSYTPGTITFLPSDTQAFPVSGIAGGVVGGGVGLILLLVVVVVIIVVVYRRDSVKKSHQMSALLNQMEMLETNMAEECKRAFTELQTELQDVVNVHDKNYPYRDFRSFAMKILFPTAKDDHPILKPVQFPYALEPSLATKSLELFKGLLMDKQTLLTIIQSLEEQLGRYTVQNRCNVASLLIVALQDNMPYVTEVLVELLKAHMIVSNMKGNPKLLLRRTESVAEKLLSNWLCFLLYPYVQEHVGEPLFTLFKAIKGQLEKGPVDAITGEARNSLSEETLLRQHLNVNIVEGVVESDNDLIPIKLLDTDTISQAKEKILDVLYRNTPASRRPQISEVDLELRRGNAGIKLHDHDTSNERDGDWIKVNTLGHYKLDQMALLHSSNSTVPPLKFRLRSHQEDLSHSTNLDVIGTILASNEPSLSPINQEGVPRYYHLVQSNILDSDVEEGKAQSQGIVSEVFLTRMLATKRVLQPYVDDLFKALFSTESENPIPKAIKYLFDFLQLQAADMGITDPDVIHMWKTHSIQLHFWYGLIQNPDFVFDIHKSKTINSCLQVISQAYLDACCTSEIKYTKDTPSGRLLYANEVTKYKGLVRQYYDKISSVPKLDPKEMDSYLSEASQFCHSFSGTSDIITDPNSTSQQHVFHSESALYELLKYTVQYSTEICRALIDERRADQAEVFQAAAAALKIRRA